jgi:hypothetical protein
MQVGSNICDDILAERFAVDDITRRDLMFDQLPVAEVTKGQTTAYVRISVDGD